MTDSYDELLNIADNLEQLAAQGSSEEIQQPLERLDKAVREVQKAWSGSWLGYHANVYTGDLQPPHPRGLFDPMVGLDRFKLHFYSSWREYAPQEVEEAIYQLAGNPNINPVFAFNDKASSEFHTHKFTLLSILDLELSKSTSSLLSDLKEEVDNLSLVTDSELVRSWVPEKVISSDDLALSQGIMTPPHFSIGAKVVAVQRTLKTVIELKDLITQVTMHLSRQRSHQQTRRLTGEGVFIGHGRSHIWRQLKDFLEDDLGLLVDEFNRVPTAGVSINSRLSAMLDSTAIAFLVMTGEDEQPGGALRARENVVHEAGLFQGRLGFERAIVLLEDGCEKFSNNAGLVHINFPKNNIRASFQDLRDVLAREGILKSGATK